MQAREISGFIARQKSYKGRNTLHTFQRKSLLIVKTQFFFPLAHDVMKSLLQGTEKKCLQTGMENNPKQKN